MIFLLASCADTPAATVTRVSDINGKIIGCMEGTVASEIAAAYGTARQYASYAALAADLRLGVLDCAIADQYSADKIKSAASHLVLLEDPLVASKFSFAVHEEYPDLLSVINGAVETLVKQNAFKPIAEHWLNGKDYTAPKPVTGGTVITLALPDRSFAPYYYVDADGNVSGYCIDIALLVFGSLGLSLEFDTFSELRQLNQVRLGLKQYIGVAWEFAALTVDGISYSASYGTLEMVVVTRK